MKGTTMSKLTVWYRAHRKAVAAFAGSELVAVLAILALDHISWKAAAALLLAPFAPGYATHKASNE